MSLGASAHRRTSWRTVTSADGIFVLETVSCFLTRAPTVQARAQ